VIRTNLSTRPFYNERAVLLWLLVAALVVVSATLFNVSRVLRYSRSDTQLATQAARDEAHATDLRQQAARLRATVDPRQIEFASTEARQANELIDRRTFSWTDLFNRFETTLPDDVRITAIRSRIDKEQELLTVQVVARSNEDIDKFMGNLEATGAFTDLGRRIDEHVNDENQMETGLDMVYLASPKPQAAAPGAENPAVPDPEKPAVPGAEKPAARGAERPAARGAERPAARGAGAPKP
jgi:Tfp pilus assembly protein PilN